MPRVAVLLTMFVLCPSAAPSGDAKDWKDANPKDLGIAFVKPLKDEKTGFIVGGKNDTALIKKLTHLNGKTIEELEKVMRPGVSSGKGFLGKDESLLAILADDNDFVIGKLGLTHQELARHLLILAALAESKGKTVLYHGRKLHLQSISFRGVMPSPFADGTKTNTEVTITNEASGKKLIYSTLVPMMMERYGFYEGHGTPYRVDPRRIVEVLDFVAEKGS